MFHKIVDAISGNNEENKKKIKGRVVLMKKHVLDLNDINALVVDDVHELLGQRVSLQLISAVNLDHSGLYLIFAYLFMHFPLNSYTSSIL